MHSFQEFMQKLYSFSRIARTAGDTQIIGSMCPAMIERNNMVKSDILGCANLLTQIARPLITLNNGFAIYPLNYGCVHFARTASNSHFCPFFGKVLPPYAAYFPSLRASIISKPLLMVFRIVFAIVLHAMVFIGLRPLMISRSMPFWVLMHRLANIFTMLFWIGVIVGFFNFLVAVLAPAMKTPRAISIKFARWFFHVASDTSFYRNALLICRSAVEESSRVIPILLHAFLMTDGILTLLATGMKVSRISRAELTNGLHLSAKDTLLCFWYLLRWLLFAFRSPFSLCNGPTFTTFRAPTPFAWLHFKGLFGLFDPTFGTSLHDNLHSFVANIVVEGAGGVKWQL